MRRGDVVAYMLGNSPAVFDVLLGAQKLGAIGGPISCWWQAAEVEYLVNDSRAKVLVVDPEYVPIAAAIAGSTPTIERIIVNSPQPVEIDRPHEVLPEIMASGLRGAPDAEPPAPTDTAALMYTSGTTGQPKGVMLSHRGVLGGARLKTSRVSLSPGDRGLCVLPLFHSGGLNDLAFPDDVPRGHDRLAAELLRLRVLGLRRALPDQRLLHRSHHVEHPAPGHRIEECRHELACASASPGPRPSRRSSSRSAGSASGSRSSRPTA